MEEEEEGEGASLPSLAAPPRLPGGELPEAVATDGSSLILPRLRLGALLALGWLVVAVFPGQCGNRRRKPPRGGRITLLKEEE